ncbi:CHAP domain-containing protein [Pseudomonas putida]|uniref:Peptidase C51 domain-containing protein n=1 Tax=Pseudomonas putida TaxID=303 RepID=A0A1Q9QUW4_PSEPU|nr:CHAP domain-containing protein [Pseudomonas putida]OLS58842.1 hypothetical protein PSEMO_62030 [Pseudomonas putida]
MTISNKRILILLATCAALLLVVFTAHAMITRIDPNPRHTVGEQLDELNGVAIYYNGGVNTVLGRNLSPDGYNLGLRYQCVEFVKRYYFERYDHRMPDSYGHAKDFFDPRLIDGEVNPQRAMLQFRNGSSVRPQAEDLLVFAPTLLNRYGHVAVIANVGEGSLEIAQQNPGPFAGSRETLRLMAREGRWYVEQSQVLGWLRLSDVEGFPPPM